MACVRDSICKDLLITLMACPVCCEHKSSHVSSDSKHRSPSIKQQSKLERKKANRQLQNVRVGCFFGVEPPLSLTHKDRSYNGVGNPSPHLTGWAPRHISPSSLHGGWQAVPLQYIYIYTGTGVGNPWQAQGDVDWRGGEGQGDCSSSAWMMMIMMMMTKILMKT